MKIKPLDDRVLIEAMDEEVKKGSIILPDSAKEKPVMGKVIAVGNDEELQKVIKVNDKVIYGKYAGDEVKVDDKKFLIISRSDILATVE